MKGMIIFSEKFSFFKKIKIRKEIKEIILAPMETKYSTDLVCPSQIAHRRGVIPCLSWFW